MIKKILFALLLVVTSLQASTEEKETSEFDSLGGNSILLEKAAALQPEFNKSVVQSRTVNRRHRVELNSLFGGVFGGDTYTRTHSMGLGMQYHFTPRWSVGVRFEKNFNRLTTEGQALVERAERDFKYNPTNPTATIPDLDYPLQTATANVNWYPIYGKFSWLEKNVVQFDVYGLLGAGQVVLKSSTTSIQEVGAGMAFWMNQSFSTRVEMKYQNYQALYVNGPQKLDLVAGSVQVGWLL